MRRYSSSELVRMRVRTVVRPKRLKLHAAPHTRGVGV